MNDIKRKPCEKCAGTGVIHKGFYIFAQALNMPCPECDGTGLKLKLYYHGIHEECKGLGCKECLNGFLIARICMFCSNYKEDKKCHFQPPESSCNDFKIVDRKIIIAWLKDNIRSWKGESNENK